MPNRLNLYDEVLAPVSRFFNIIPKSRFVSAIKHLAKRSNYSFNDVGCSFPENIDEEDGDEPFEGIQFWGPDDEDEVIIPEASYLSYLKRACDAHLKEHPEEEEELMSVLKEIR